MTTPPLYCLCGGLIRPDVVFFGEAIPPAAQDEAEELAQDCDLLLVIGTSGEVAPASYIPSIAKEWRALIVENNLEPTRLTTPHRPLPSGLGRKVAAPGFARTLGAGTLLDTAISIIFGSCS